MHECNNAGMNEWPISDSSASAAWGRRWPTIFWPPGTRQGYHAVTFGHLVGELVRRTDPKHRSLGVFVREELAATV